MNAHPARTFSGNRQKAAAEDKVKAEAEFEGRLKERNDGSYEAFSQLSDSERQAVLISESEAYRHADTEARSWGIGGSKSRAVNAGTILLTGILGGQSDLQIAANTLSPYAAAAIGNTFGHGENKNETAQLVGHFLLGATLAYINGGDPLSGGGAAVAAEKAAQYLSQQYNDGNTAIDPQTGEFNPNLLPEQIKEEIKATTGVIASIVGATGDGGAALNAQIGGVLGQNAVENNYLLPTDWSKYHEEIAKCQGKGAHCHTQAAKELEEISKRRNRELAQACSVYGSIEACTAKQNEAKQSAAYTRQQLAAIPSGIGKPSAPILQYLDKVGADYPISDGLIAVSRLKQLDALASSPEFIKAYRSDAKVRQDFKKQVESLASIVQQSGRAKEGFMFDKEVPLTNISKLGGINTGEVGIVPVYPELELIGLGIGKATTTVATKLLSSMSLKVGGREFSQPLGQRVMSTVDGEMAGGNKPIIYRVSEGKADSLSGRNLADNLTAKMSKPIVNDQDLKKIVDDLYRANAKIGSGSTADAVRYELKNNTKVGGREHSEKARNYSVALERWLAKNPDASFSDRSTANNILRDLQNALKGK